MLDENLCFKIQWSRTTQITYVTQFIIQEIFTLNSHHRARRRPLIEAEALESRHLLNAHVPHHPAAHVSQHSTSHVTAEATKSSAPTKAPHVISGTLTGIGPGTANPSNSNQGIDTYYATAKTKNGVATYYGTDGFTSTPINATSVKDTYFNGSTVLYLAGNNEVAINYVGHGPYPTQSHGSYSASFTGEAIGITGSVTGHVYSFKATLKGDAATNDISIKFTLKG